MDAEERRKMTGPLRVLYLSRRSGEPYHGKRVPNTPRLATPASITPFALNALIADPFLLGRDPSIYSSVLLLYGAFQDSTSQ